MLATARKKLAMPIKPHRKQVATIATWASHSDSCTAEEDGALRGSSSQRDAGVVARAIARELQRAV